MLTCYRMANFAPFQKKKFAAENITIILRLSGKWPTFLYCFHICDTKCTYEDTAVQPARWFLLALQFVRPKSRKSLFCIDKARKRSFTEVAFNSVLEENAIDFAWEFCWNFCQIFILQFNLFYKRCICCFPKILIGGSVQCNLIAYCAQCNAYFMLCVQKKQARGFVVLARNMGPLPYDIW